MSLSEIRYAIKLIIGDTVRLNALVTARAFDKRDYEYAHADARPQTDRQNHTL